MANGIDFIQRQGGPVGSQILRGFLSGKEERRRGQDSEQRRSRIQQQDAQSLQDRETKALAALGRPF